MRTNPSRRTFLAMFTAAASTAAPQAQGRGRITGFNHVALPMENLEAMEPFYRRLGFEIRTTANVMSVYAGANMINFHRSHFWRNPTFTLRAPAAKPPCGDLCFVWDGTAAALKDLLAGAGARIETGPVDRSGGRQKSGSSVYVRDPDGNLLEFIIYA